MKQRVAILNYAGCNNYGANLTAYALLRRCGQLGCKARLIDRRFAYEFQEKAQIFNAFSRRYLKWTAPCYGREYAKRLNRHYDTFIVGSDQVWTYRPDWERLQLVAERPMYDLEFAAPGKKRIGMAVSFGSTDYSRVPADFVAARRQALSYFDAISVREHSGVDICRRYFGAEALHVMDPVYLLPAEEWSRLAAHDRTPLPSRYAATCLLEEKVFAPAMNDILRLWNASGSPLPAVNTLRGSVEAWVRTVRDAEIVITDSFHVCCFAIIFRKPFLYLNPQSRGTERVPSMLADLGLHFPCLSEEDAHSPEALRQAVEALRGAAYPAGENSLLGRRIAETDGFLRRALKSEPRRNTPDIRIDPGRMAREFRFWNPFRFSVLKRHIRRSAVLGRFFNKS